MPAVRRHIPKPSHAARPVFSLLVVPVHSRPAISVRSHPAVPALLRPTPQSWPYSHLPTDNATLYTSLNTGCRPRTAVVLSVPTFTRSARAAVVRSSADRTFAQAVAGAEPIDS